MLHPVIMAGGSGTRFWPHSRRRRPKQLLRIFGDRSLLQQAVDRLLPELPAASFLVITTRDQADEVRAQLPQFAPEQTLAEPCGRDTAACIGLGACIVRKRDPDAVMAVLSADHLIVPAEVFRQNLREATELARAHRALVAFGVKPTEPSELYGYIRRGRPLPGVKEPARAFEVAAFTEKPDRKTAEEFLRTGEYYWNSGNFVWRAEDILAAIEHFLPDLRAGLRRIEPALGTPDQERALEAEYPRLARTSIDYGVMEKAPNAVVLESSFEWDDVGAWNAVARHQPADADGNVIRAKFAGIDVRNCIIVGEEDHLVTAINVRDLIIVHTPDATLVCDRRRAADVKALVDILKSRGWDIHL